ncbi:MAG: radical SAM family heme chaperone HemW [Dehalococcoidia bacterium]|nr:radical SAM family heme chaperone HemW [Dehalococcoidia bacterium]
MRGLYIHIPFCVSKCFYCDFYSVSEKLGLMDEYIDVLLAEADSCRGMDFSTLYLGGGTPSILGAERLEKLVIGLRRRFDLHDLQESTIEVNPESAGIDLLATAYRLGIGRVSIGIQSLNDGELKKSGRAHNRRQALETIDSALSSGYRNISADIMIGLPGQTAQSLGETLSVLTGAGINHVSAYCLSVEEGTAFYRCPPPDLPGEDEQASLFEYAVDILKTHGFVHYEISNLARPGSECLHNLNYWRGGEYLGLGPAAASHISGTRFRNSPNLERYLVDPLSDREGEEHLEDASKAGEEAMLRLRLVQEGLDMQKMNNKYGRNAIEGVEARPNKLVGRRSLAREGDVFRLQPAYVLISNSVFIDVIG